MLHSANIRPIYVFLVLAYCTKTCHVNLCCRKQHIEVVGLRKTNAMIRCVCYSKSYQM